MVPGLTLAVFAFDILLAIVAMVDYFVSRTLPEGLTIERDFLAGALGRFGSPSAKR